MAKIIQDMPNLKKEMKNLQMIIFMQDSKLDKIQQRMMELEPMLGDSAATPAIMDFK